MRPLRRRLHLSCALALLAVGCPGGDAPAGRDAPRSPQAPDAAGPGAPDAAGPGAPDEAGPATPSSERVGGAGAASVPLPAPAAGPPWPDAFVAAASIPDLIVTGCIGEDGATYARRVADRRVGWELAVVLGGVDALAARLEVRSPNGRRSPVGADDVRPWLAAPPDALPIGDAWAESLHELAAAQAAALAGNARRYRPAEVEAYAPRGAETVEKAAGLWTEWMRARATFGRGGRSGRGAIPPPPPLELGPPESLAGHLAVALGRPDGLPTLPVAVGAVQAVGRLRVAVMLGPGAALVLEWPSLAPDFRGFLDQELHRGAPVQVTLHTAPGLAAQHVFLAGPAVPPPEGHRAERARSGRVLLATLEGGKARLSAQELVFASGWVAHLPALDVALGNPAPP